MNRGLDLLIRSKLTPTTTPDGEMRRLQRWAAIVAALTALVVAGSSSVAHAAAWPTTSFPTVSRSYGYGKITVTWYNRSVGVVGEMGDVPSDHTTLVVCVWAFTSTNGNGSGDRECRGAADRVRDFAFTMDPNGLVAGDPKFNSVKFGLCYYTIHDDPEPPICREDDDIYRTRNRPA